MLRTRNQAAFTLLELLAVMLVIALVTALATLSFAPGSRDLDTEAERLLATATLASEEAVIRGRQYGLSVFRSAGESARVGYAWLAWDGREWRALSERPFESHWLPDALSVSVELENRPVALGSNRISPDSGISDTPPQIRFFSSGETDRFRIEIGRDASSRLIMSDPQLGLSYRELRGEE